MKCNRMLLAAVMGMSLSAGAFAQSNSSGGAAGSSGTGNQNQTGGSAPAAGGTGLTTPSDADRATAGASGSSSSSATGSATSGDTAGNLATSTERSVQRGAIGGDADAQLSAQMDKLASMPDKAADGLFVLDNAKGNLFEIEFARLAQSKSQDEQIKQLAQMIEKDHTQANDQLKTIAQKMGLELPTSLPTDKQKMLQVLSAMNPQDFDTCYLLDNKMAHAKDITSFADHAKSVKDEDLRKYITAVLPRLQQHGQHVQQLASAKGYPTPIVASRGSSDAVGNVDNSTGRSLTGSDATGGSTSGSTSGSNSGAGSSSGTGTTGSDANR